VSKKYRKESAKKSEEKKVEKRFREKV